MPTDVQTLMEMGFPQNQAEKALSKTGYKGVQVAMDWLFAHADDADIDEPFKAPPGHVLGAPGENPPGKSEDSTEQAESANKPAQAMSLKCEDCGKLFKAELDVQAHAARTGHANFSESTEEVKPLTEEEKKQQLERLQEKMKQKREEREAREKEEKIQKEKARRMTGKEMVEAKAKFEENEMKKLAELKRREKEEERLARQKVKEEIERDKRERAAKFAKKTPAAAEPPPQVTQTQPQVKKDYDSCRLQIRLPSGQAVTENFKAKEQLAAVRLFIEMNHSSVPAPFTFMTSFPKKVFNNEDMEKPLDSLGLVPSAVLIVKQL